jgi:hypothetical protein
MQIKDWMIGGPIVIIIALGSLYLTASMQNDREQTNIDTSGILHVATGDTTGDACDKGTIAVVKTWNMPNELREISGIALLDSTRVATIEDTRGTIFIYNLTDEKIEKQIQFGKQGDYEGIAYAQGSYFVLRSDGYLFEVNEQGKVLHEYDLPLNDKDDTESLFYNAPNNRLLVGQKEGGKDVIKKGIFAFDLKTRQFNDDPVYSFDPNVSFCDSVPASNGEKKGGASKGNAGKIVKPSDIAIHPITHEIFVVDGPNQRVLVLSPEGTPLYFLKLDKTFEQAEGLMFSPSGDLFISTEGIRRPGNISKVTVPAMIQ